MDGKLLVVVSIISAKNFPTRLDYSLVVKGFFNKECLDTDPVPHTGPSVQINTELAWEMSKKDLQYHKLHRTPIKLVCIAEKKDKKEECGYVLLDLRSAKQKGIPQVQEPMWYSVLNSSYSKKKQQPELQVYLTLEDAEEEVPSSTAAADTDTDLKLVLHPSGEYYTLGSASVSETKMFLYSVMLQNPIDLPLPEAGSNFHFYFDLFGHHMASESFVPPDFRPERSAIRIKTTGKFLLRFLRGLDEFMVCLCCGNQVIGKGYVPIHSLGINETMTCTLLLGVGHASVDVCITVGEFLGTEPTSSSSDSNRSLEKGLQHTKPRLSASQQKSKSAKRNLSQKFEDASAAGFTGEAVAPGASHYSVISDSSQESVGHSHSRPVPISSSSSSTAFSLPRLSKAGSPSATLTGLSHHAMSESNGRTHVSMEMHGHRSPTSPHRVYRRSRSSSAPSPPQIWSPSVHQYQQRPSFKPKPSPPSPSAAIHHPSSAHSPRVVAPSSCHSSQHFAPRGHSQSSPTYDPATSSHPSSATQYSMPYHQSQKVSSATPSHQPNSLMPKQSISGGIHPHNRAVRDDKMGAGVEQEGSGKEDIYFSEAIWFSTTGQIGNCKHFKFSLDMRSLQDSSLEIGPSYYLRYSYAFFGCPYPVLVQPPVPLVFPGANLSFIQSFCSFDFAVQYDNLVRHVTQHPLTVEVWSVSPSRRDFIAGLSQVPLHEVFSQEKSCLPDGAVRQVVSLQCPVFSPCSDFSHPESCTGKPRKSTSLLASLNITVVMEDIGFLTREKVKSGEVSHFSAKKKSRRMDDEMQMVVDSHTKAVEAAAGERESSERGGAARHQEDRTGEGHISTSPDFVEYRAAMELEMWKGSEEEAFQEYLKNLEASHMTKLGEEWRKRETERHELFKKKLDQYTILEKRLMEGLQKLQVHQQSVAAKEMKINQEKAKLKQEKENMGKLHEAEMSAAKSTFEQQIELERHKVNDLQEQLESMKKRMHNELKSKEEELERYKKELPSSKVMSDLEILRLEKEELQRKVTVLTSAKDQYKNKWKEALAELARHHREEQHMTQKRLMAQERELEDLRKDIVKLDEQNNLNLQISNVKEDAERIQEHIISIEQEEAESTVHGSGSCSHHCGSHSPHHHHHAPHHTHHHAHHHASHSAVEPHSHSPPSNHLQKQPMAPCMQHGHKHTHTHAHSGHTCHAHDSPPNLSRSLTADVARWIEEREILLQTGVYSDTDVTIQTLDAKIRGAMLKINSD